MENKTPETDNLVDVILPTKIPLTGRNDEWYRRQSETASFARQLELSRNAALKKVGELENGCAEKLTAQHRELCAVTDEYIKKFNHAVEVGKQFAEKRDHNKRMWEGQYNRTKLAEQERDALHEQVKSLENAGYEFREWILKQPINTFDVPDEIWIKFSTAFKSCHAISASATDEGRIA